MLSVEIREATIRRRLRDLSLNNECMKAELDLLDELREKARIKEAVCKQRAARRYNVKVNLRNFQQGDLVWRMTGDASKNQTDGKFAANWEGQYRVSQVLCKGAVRLEQLDGEQIPNTWNADHLKFYFSESHELV